MTVGSADNARLQGWRRYEHRDVRGRVLSGTRTESEAGCQNREEQLSVKKPARILPVIFIMYWLPGTGSTILTGSELDVL